jgi:hypothetical protein
MNFTEAMAWSILGAYDVCHGESIIGVQEMMDGKTVDLEKVREAQIQIMNAIREQLPQIAKLYSYLWETE